MTAKARGVALAGLLVAACGGAYMMTTSDNRSSQRTPKEVANAFIEAVIRGDSNSMGVLMGIDSSKGSPMQQAFGKELGSLLDDYWSDQANNPADYRWELQEEQVAENFAKLRVDLFSPDTAAIANKMGQLLGETTGPDGTLQMPEMPPMPVEEALRLAKSDRNIQPLHFRVPMRLVRHEGQWVVDPQTDVNDALVSAIRRGDTLTDNEAYLVK